MLWRGNQRDGFSNRQKQLPISISNEFAAVSVRLVETHNGDSVLEVRDVRHGLQVRLDALEIEALTRLTPEDRTVLVDPTRPGITKPSADAVRYFDEEASDFESGFDIF